MLRTLKAWARLDWGLLQRIALLWFAAVVAASLLDPDRLVLSRPGLVEATAWLAILSALASVPALGAFVGAMPRPHRRFLCGVIALLLFGQFMGVRADLTFPVVSWRMFGTGAVELQPFTF